MSKTIVGASLSFVGTLIKSPAKVQLFELAVNADPNHKAVLIGNADGTYPIQGRPTLEVIIFFIFHPFNFFFLSDPETRAASPC